MLYLRGGLTRSEIKEIAADILEDKDNSGDIVTGIFSQVKVYTGLLNVKSIMLDKF